MKPYRRLEKESEGSSETPGSSPTDLLSRALFKEGLRGDTLGAWNPERKKSKFTSGSHNTPGRIQ